MILYVGFAQPDEWVTWAQTYAKHAQRFEQAAGGEMCLTIPFNRVTQELMDRLAPRAVVLSGFARSFQDYDIRSFHPVCRWVEQAENMPILALCGSHQLLGFLYNGDVWNLDKLCDEPIRKRRPGEPITNADYHPEWFMERGYYELSLHGEDSLFAGCGKPPIVFESHYCEIKKLPPGFKLLASTRDVRIQAMRHEKRPLVGLEFHPEDYSDRFPDGKRILENFFRMRAER